MPADLQNPALRRLLDIPRVRAAFDTLCDELSGADLTTLLLAVFNERVTERTPADIVRQYQSDRFVAPGQVDTASLLSLERNLLATLDPEFPAVTLAPVAPFGTHSVLGTVPQNNVITTGRLSEVTADPTNSLALEVAARRTKLLKQEPRSVEATRLAAVHRVVRAQHFDGPRSFAHFSLLGLVCAGRDTGNRTFETSASTEMLQALIHAIRNETAAPISVRVTPFSADFEPASLAIVDACRTAGATADIWREREHGRGYYQNICFKIAVHDGADEYEIGDGGDVYWTQELLQSRKERLLIGGLGLDRLAMLLADQ